MHIPLEDLREWNVARELNKICHHLGSRIPPRRRDLREQLDRSCSSIQRNIAEGHGRFGASEFLRFLTIADASLQETKASLIEMRDLQFVEPEEVDRALELAAEA